MNAVIFPLTRLQGLRVVLWRLALAPLVLGLRFWQVVGGGVGAERRGARGSHGRAGFRARRAGRTPGKLILLHVCIHPYPNPNPDPELIQ